MLLTNSALTGNLWRHILQDREVEEGWKSVSRSKIPLAAAGLVLLKVKHYAMKAYEKVDI
jgi:hypothetical protein